MKMPDGWKEVKLGDILLRVDYGTAAKSNFSGKCPVLRMGNLKDGKIDWSDLVYTSSTDEIKKYQLVTGDILFNRTNSRDLVGKTAIYRNEYPAIFAGYLIRLRVKNECDAFFLNYYMNSEKFINFCKAVRTDAIGQSNINAQSLQCFRFLLPPLPEQKTIADMLSVWDSMIEKTEKLIDEKEKKYSWFMEKVFSVKGKKEQVLVKKFAQEVSVRNSSLSVTQVLSVTNKNGFVLPEEQFSRQVASSDLSNYKIVKKGQFAYNPSRISVGSIARLDNWDTAVLSPMYTVFEIKEDMVNSDYFLHWLHSHRANQKIKTCAQGGVRAIVNFSDFASISLYVPEKRKQDEIADVLNSMQKEITLLRQLADKYKLQKQGLMQKLLTGQWRIKS